MLPVEPIKGIDEKRLELPSQKSAVFHRVIADLTEFGIA